MSAPVPSPAVPVDYHGGKVKLYRGDCLTVLRSLPDNSIDHVVSDPPYALVSIARRYGKDGAAPAKVGATGAYARASSGFMGKSWDTGERAFAVEFWLEVFRVLKPGGHVLAFSATRTYHRLACAVEDAGFEIRDMVAWLYGTGFPKNHDVAKAIDAADTLAPRRERALKFTAWMRSTGITAATIARLTSSNMGSHYLTSGQQPEVATAEMFDLMRPVLPPVPEEIEDLVRARTVESENLKRRQVVGHHEGQAHAAKWREAYEGSAAADAKPITVAFSEAAQEWEGWGTALKPGLEPLVMARKPLIGTVAENVLAYGTGGLNIDACRIEMSDEDRAIINAATFVGTSLVKSHSIGAFASDGTEKDMAAHDLGRWPANVLHDGSAEVAGAFPNVGAGSAAPRHNAAHKSVAKGHDAAHVTFGHADAAGTAARFFYSAKADADDRIGSKHPTVKPVDGMQFFVRLVAQPGAVILDPFAGTGTTGEAALREGVDCILIEREPEYQADIDRRMRLALAGPAVRRSESMKAAIAGGKKAEPPPLPLFGGV